jgi:hypothetical protein
MLPEMEVFHAMPSVLHRSSAGASPQLSILFYEVQFHDIQCIVQQHYFTTKQKV